MPGLGRSPGEGKGYPLQYSGLENSMVCIVHGILQTRILEWVAMLFSKESSHPGIEPRSPALQVDSLPSVPPGKPSYVGYTNIKHVCSTLGLKSTVT